MNLDIEKSYRKKIVAGIDEAGRGPLAGPVVASAVIVPEGAGIIDGINDSKQLTPQKRKELYERIIASYIWSIAVVDEFEIDRINMLQATILACNNAAQKLSITPDIVIVDGNMKFADIRFCSVVKGDTKSISIAAASIVAKVTRDRIMTELHAEYPAYNWQKNAGYGTAEHIKAITEHGLSKYHRRSFCRKWH